MFPNAGYQNPYGMMNQGYPQMMPQQFQTAIPFQKDEKPKTLWVGGIDSSFNEQALRNLFKNDLIYIANIKMIKDKNFCFLEFTTHEAAKSVLARYNGQPFGPQYPGKVFRLNWGSFGIGDGKRNGGQETTTHYNLFVGDLAPEIDDFTLFRAFQQRYKSVQSGKIMMDQKTGQSKGYGFVRFADENEAIKCMEEMQGVFLGSRQIKLAPATQKTTTTGGPSTTPSKSPQALMHQQQQQQMQMQKQLLQEQDQQQQQMSNDDMSLKTLYIGGLGENLTDHMILKSYFDPFGIVTNVRMLPQKKCGFVEFETKQQAILALNSMNGAQIAGNTVKVSWGKAPLKKSGTSGAPVSSSSSTSSSYQPPAAAAAPSVPAAAQAGSYAYWQQMYGGQPAAPVIPQVPIVAPVIAPVPVIAPAAAEYVSLGVEESTNSFDLMKDNERFMMKYPVTFTVMMDDEM